MGDNISWIFCCSSLLHLVEKLEMSVATKKVQSWLLRDNGTLFLDEEITCVLFIVNIVLITDPSWPLKSIYEKTHHLLHRLWPILVSPNFSLPFWICGFKSKQKVILSFDTLCHSQRAPCYPKLHIVDLASIYIKPKFCLQVPLLYSFIILFDYLKFFHFFISNILPSIRESDFHLFIFNIMIASL